MTKMYCTHCSRCGLIYPISRWKILAKWFMWLNRNQEPMNFCSGEPCTQDLVIELQP